MHRTNTMTYSQVGLALLLSVGAIIAAAAQAANAPPAARTTPATESSAYTLQHGDVIDVSVWKEPDLPREVLIRPDGGLSFPLAGGTTPYAASNDIVILRRHDGRVEALRFRYGEVERGKDLSQDVLLQSGDTVVVP